LQGKVEPESHGGKHPEAEKNGFLWLEGLSEEDPEYQGKGGGAILLFGGRSWHFMLRRKKDFSLAEKAPKENFKSINNPWEKKIRLKGAAHLENVLQNVTGRRKKKFITQRGGGKLSTTTKGQREIPSSLGKRKRQHSLQKENAEAE